LKLNCDIVKIDCSNTQITLDNLAENVRLELQSRFDDTADNAKTTKRKPSRQLNLVILDELDTLIQINDNKQLDKLLEVVIQLLNEKQVKILLVMTDSLFHKFEDVLQQEHLENKKIWHFQISSLFIATTHRTRSVFIFRTTQTQKN